MAKAIYEFHRAAKSRASYSDRTKRLYKLKGTVQEAVLKAFELLSSEECNEIYILDEDGKHVGLVNQVQFKDDRGYATVSLYIPQMNELIRP